MVGSVAFFSEFPQFCRETPEREDGTMIGDRVRHISRKSRIKAIMGVDERMLPPYEKEADDTKYDDIGDDDVSTECRKCENDGDSGQEMYRERRDAEQECIAHIFESTDISRNTLEEGSRKIVTEILMRVMVQVGKRFFVGFLRYMDLRSIDTVFIDTIKYPTNKTSAY
jgi:hypothetical protein